MKLLVAILFLILLLSSPSSIGQTNIAVGGAVMYNFQTEGIGLGIRGQFRIFRNLHVVPQAYYFPSFNKIHEFYAGANLHYEFYWFRKFTPYLAGGGFYNSWINSELFTFGLNKRSNIIPEAGGGILFGQKCWRPFIEQRYNPVWQEGTFRIGILWYPMCKGERIGPNRRTYKCPAIQ